MAFDLTTKSKNDREYSKFVSIDAGSQVAVSVNNNNLIKVYEFPSGSITAADTGLPISGGNFESFTDYRLNGLLYGIQFLAGNMGAAGSLALKTSGAGATDVWATITRATDADFVVFPRGGLVTTADFALENGVSGLYGLIPMSGIIHLIGSDVGIGKSGIGFKIIYI